MPCEISTWLYKVSVLEKSESRRMNKNHTCVLFVFFCFFLFCFFFIIRFLFIHCHQNTFYL